MKLLNFITFLTLGFMMLFINYGCAGRQQDGYDTQRWVVIGAGVGAPAGITVGHGSKGALISASVGALLGDIGDKGRLVRETVEEI